ncbi:MAG TPA: protein-methionine-sulfoxide reductase heme-binding subunit MsrQ [Vicinamibacterales bacterium]|nr:protein-methionine-sulfoxide reductase heme-binding subunit MsrQ [Vicinamibacterales bacterium]
MTANQLIRWGLKPAVFAAALVPAATISYLTWAAYNGEQSAWPALTGNLSANPLSDITNRTGLWTLRFLCLTLAVTPLRRLTGWNGAIRFRRMLGLFAFFYGTLHFLTYAILDRFMSLEVPDMTSAASWRALTVWIADDVAMRPFITVGFTAFVLMIPLALTSTAGMIRRLGGHRWQMLHRLAYVSAVAGVLHFWWLVKLDVRRPAFYGAIIAILLAFRVFRARLHAVPRRAGPGHPPVPELGSMDRQRR